jgi:hypothetical protein
MEHSLSDRPFADVILGRPQPSSKGRWDWSGDENIVWCRSNPQAEFAGLVKSAVWKYKQSSVIRGFSISSAHFSAIFSEGKTVTWA